MNRFTKWLAAGIAAVVMAGGCWFVNAKADNITEESKRNSFEKVANTRNNSLGKVAADIPNVPNNPNNPNNPNSHNGKIAETVKPPVPQFVASEKIPLEPWLQFKLKEICKDNDIPFHIALGVIEQESRFKQDSYNDGCYGLMQVSNIHAPVEILKNPVENMRLGCGILGLLHRKYGDWETALICYNCGEGGANRYYFQYGKYSSEYSRMVMLRAERWKRELGE